MVRSLQPISCGTSFFHSQGVWHTWNMAWGVGLAKLKCDIYPVLISCNRCNSIAFWLTAWSCCSWSSALWADSKRFSRDCCILAVVLSVASLHCFENLSRAVCHLKDPIVWWLVGLVEVSVESVSEAILETVNMRCSRIRIAVSRHRLAPKA